jgi:hypothetical protein
MSYIAGLKQANANQYGARRVERETTSAVNIIMRASADCRLWN